MKSFFVLLGLLQGEYGLRTGLIRSSIKGHPHRFVPEVPNQMALPLLEVGRVVDAVVPLTVSHERSELRVLPALHPI